MNILDNAVRRYNGDVVSCAGGNKFVNGICGSGRELDCKGYGYIAYCFQIANVEVVTNSCYNMNGDPGEEKTCNDNYVLTRYCGTGMHASCNLAGTGNTYTSGQCCQLRHTWSDGSNTWTDAAGT